MSRRLEDQLVAAIRKTLAGGKPVVPEGGMLIWSFFVELSGSRSYSMTGPNPISYAEIEAWARLHRWPVQPHHIAILRAMDGAWLQHSYSKGGMPISGHTPSGPAQPINAGAFDAVFG